MRKATATLTLLLLCCFTAATAQDDVDYRFEVGAAAGTSFYRGELNHKFFSQLGAAGGITGRWNIDPFMSVKAVLDYASVKGSTSNTGEFFPDDPHSSTAAQPRTYKLSDGVVDLSATLEYNFWPFGLHHGYQGRQRITPFAQLGIGACYGKAGKAFTFQVPMGVGVKYKLRPRVNVGLDMLYHFSLSDKLDNFENPHGISSSGFKHKDDYCTMLLYITYEFSPKCPQCNKND